MTDPKIDLKNPWVAGILAYLIPGAGHLYQRRIFKGVLYFVCVFGTFLYGMQLGEWKVVYWTENPGQERFGAPAKRNYGYLTQLGIGIPSLYAYVQTCRYRRPENHPAIINMAHTNKRVPLSEEIEAGFEGHLVQPEDPHDQENRRRRFIPVEGTVTLRPKNRVFEGAFEGTAQNDDGEAVPFEVKLGETLMLDSKVLGNDRRKLAVGVLGPNGQFAGELDGTIPRSFGNWFEAPMDSATLQDLNNRLTKRFEMALVYTWIAGLLNILVIWDAIQGPAYGYDDEQYRQSQKSKDEPKSEAAKSEAVAAAESDGEDGEEHEKAAVVGPSAAESATKSLES